MPISYFYADHYAHISLLSGAHINSTSNDQEPNPSHLADSSSDQEPIWHRDGEESPNSQAAKPTVLSRPNVLESNRPPSFEFHFFTFFSPSLLFRTSPYFVSIRDYYIFIFGYFFQVLIYCILSPRNYSQKLKFARKTKTQFTFRV